MSKLYGGPYATQNCHEWNTGSSLVFTACGQTGSYEGTLWRPAPLTSVEKAIALGYPVKFQDDHHGFTTSGALGQP